MRVAILVIGDLGHSPRMLYHAHSLALNGFYVDLVGYRGSSLPENISNNPKITIHYLFSPWKIPSGYPRIFFLLYAPFKVLAQILALLWIFFFAITRPNVILMQNPPAIPSMLVLYVVSTIRNCSVIIDWHNLAYSILALSMPSNSALVKFAKWHERTMGKMANQHITVTRAMSEHLTEKWEYDIEPVVLYDKPPIHFKRLDDQERHDFLLSLSEELPQLKDGKQTLFTAAGKLRKNRPALIVTGTSWTPDEDVQLLLDSVEEYHRQRLKKPVLPSLCVIITGKGPLKEAFEERIKYMDIGDIKIITAWLAIEDYPKLLGSADIGVSLHYSSSGLDLPMKVVDMFGCGLPVLSIDYACITELVRPSQTGLLFKDAKELCACFKILLSKYPLETPMLDQMKEKIAEEFRDNRWHDNWNKFVLPIIKNQIY